MGNSTELQGNAWAFLSIEAVRAVFQTLMAKGHFTEPHNHNCSLTTGFFGDQAVLTFLWDRTVAPELVASVKRLALLAGGEELDKDAKQALLHQARLRWKVRRVLKPLGGTIVRHHPHGKVWWDFTD